MIAEAAIQSRFPFRSMPEIVRAQQRRLRATIVYAQVHVPYYRETMRRLGLAPDDLRTASDLGRLPVIERDQVQRDPEYFLSDAWPPSACVTLHSGGSTGAPLTVFRDPASFFLDAAQRERQRSLVARLAGRRVRYREAAIVPEDSSTSTALSEFRRRTLLPTGVRVQRRSFSMLRSPADLLAELEAYRPDVIRSYGSYLEAFFTHIRDAGLRPHLPRVAAYGSDGISPEICAWVKSELGIEVIGSYNAIETPLIGYECDHHRGYHLNIDLCPVRVLSADGREAELGEHGEIVVSNLVNRATMLLNYRLGDTVGLLAEQCSCGRTLPLCSYLGRTTTAWLDFDGGRVHSQALRLVFRKERQIVCYQVVRETGSRILVRVVPSRGADRDAIARRVVHGLNAQLGEAVAVRVEMLVDLPRGPSGKMQAIVVLDPPAA
jgi:phenylacetate-CoA ligase